MKLRYLHRLAYKSFENKFLNANCITTNIIKAFLGSVLLSLPIFAHHFNLPFLPLFSLVALVGLGVIFTLNRRELFVSGFFIGVIWFHWISFSFIHYGFWYLLPFGLVGVGLIYALMFFTCGYVKNDFLRAVALFLVTLINPFGFNWLDFRVLFVSSPFGVDFVSLGLIFLVVFLVWKKSFFAALVPLVLALNFPQDMPNNTLPNIKIINTQIPQSQKWQNRLAQAKEVESQINKAIDEGFDIVLFPESALPYALNKEPYLTQILKEHSHQISIVLGALHVEDENIYNSTYFFDKGEYSVAHKFILVPFGEEIPLPKVFKDAINKLFFNSAEDFAKAEGVSDFMINGELFRNAICYEASRYELYADKPRYMLAQSNNAWFTPSFEPTIQKLLLHVNASLNGTTIFHSVNGSESYMIIPKANRPLYMIITELVF